MQQKKEEWRPVAGYEELYEVSDLGNVRNARNKRKLKPFGQQAHDYLTVNLKKGDVQKTYLVHRLVAEAFCEKPGKDGKLEVNHLNYNKLDNRAENLEFCTHKENANWSTNRRSRISKFDRETGECLGTWPDMDSVLADPAHAGLGWNAVNIRMSLNGWNRTAFGYRWEYIDKPKEDAKTDPA